MELEKLRLENRINLLLGKSPEESRAIIKKLERKLRKLKEPKGFTEATSIEFSVEAPMVE